MIAQNWDLHVAFIRWHQSEAEGPYLLPLGKGKIDLIQLVLGCDVVAEKTNEPAVLTAAFIGD